MVLLCEHLGFKAKLNPKHNKIDNGALFLYNIKHLVQENFDEKTPPYLNLKEDFSMIKNNNYQLFDDTNFTFREPEFSDAQQR